MHTTKRISALLIALAMMLMGLTALAEPAALPAQLPAEAVYERGGAIKTDMEIELNKDVILSLANQPEGSLGERGLVALTNVLGAITKLTTTVVQNKAGFSAVVGTEAGQVADAQGIANLETGEVSFTTNLLPGVKLQLPKEMLQETLDSQAKMTAMLSGANADMLKPYADAIMKAFQANLAEVTVPQVGTFEVAGVGTFQQMAEFDITQETIAAFIDAINGVLKQDTRVQNMLDEYLKMANAQMEAQMEAVAAAESMAAEGAAPSITMPPQAQTVQSAADLTKALDEAVAELRKDGTVVVAHQRLYAQGDAQFYTEFEFPNADGTSDMMLSVLGNEQQGGAKLSITMIMDAETPTYYTAADPTAAATPEPTPVPTAKDWSAVKAAILDESKPMGVLAQIDVVFGADPAANKSTAKIDINFLVPGIMGLAFNPSAFDAEMTTLPPHFTIGMTAETNTSLGTPYTADATVALTAFAKDPLVKITTTSVETTDAPAPLAETTTTMALAETISEADQKTLTDALKSGLPSLLERLRTALPEEGSVLATMIEEAMQPATVTAN